MMKEIEAFLVNYLLNSLWQVPLFFGATCGVVYLLRRHSSLTVHRVWTGSLLLQVVFPALAAERPSLVRMVARLLAPRPNPDGSLVTVSVGPASHFGALPFSAGFMHVVERAIA